MYLEWSGEFEHQMHARRTLSIILPIVLLVIFVLLYITYHDLADTLLVLLLAVPGAVAGGMLFQFLFGFPFTVAVWVGYIACFGLATQSGLVMLVYLREAIDRRGGLENIHSVAELRAAIMDGRRSSHSSQAAYRNNDHRRLGADAVGQRCGGGNHATNGRSRARRPAGFRRNHRPAAPGRVLPHPSLAVENNSGERDDF